MQTMKIAIVRFLNHKNNNYIYPLDRISPSFDIPLFCSEIGISKIITINTTAYLFVGFNGNIYQTNGSNVAPYWSMPRNLSKITYPYFFWTDATFSRNQIYERSSLFMNGNKRKDNILLDEKGILLETGTNEFEIVECNN